MRRLSRADVGATIRRMAQELLVRPDCVRVSVEQALRGNRPFTEWIAEALRRCRDPLLGPTAFDVALVKELVRRERGVS